MPEDDSLKVARYIFENPKPGETMVPFDEDTELDKQTFISKLSRMVNLNDNERDYLVFSESEVPQLLRQVRKELTSCKMSLEETIKLDDDENKGFVSYEGLKESFEVMELSIESKLEEFILYYIYS